ncbi:TlpA disulfide reductase family protein [Butyricimonas hominis]|uniref:redoxin family protein n=1 Tax=Butyricimonas TaxID=574697 RepID=UPI003518CECE
MRLVIIAILLCCAWGCSEAGGYCFTMKGRVPDMKYGTVFIRTNDSESRVLASADLDNYEFILKGELEEPGCYVLQVNDKKMTVLLDGQELVAEFLEGAHLKNLKGSPAQDCFKKYEMEMGKKVSEMSEKNVDVENIFSFAAEDELQQLRFKETCIFIEKNPDNIASAHIALTEMKNDYDKGIKMYELLSERVKRLEIGKALKRKLEQVESVANGKKFPEIEVCSIAGDSLTLKDWSGSVYVIDFWASWCGPCRAELQYLKKLYKELEGKGVKFVSVSLDNSPKAWARANAEEKLEWLSVRNRYGFDLEQGICKALDIRSIPFIVVLDKDGTVAGKSLRQEVLRNKLLEMLK